MTLMIQMTGETVAVDVLTAKESGLRSRDATARLDAGLNEKLNLYKQRFFPYTVIFIIV